jgi:hypothetical protein
MLEGQLLMTQADRDRLVALKKAKKKLITQQEAAEELGLRVRQVKRLLYALKERVRRGRQAETARQVKAAESHRAGRRGSDWNKNFDLKKGPRVWQAAEAPGYRRDAVD